MSLAWRASGPTRRDLLAGAALSWPIAARAATPEPIVFGWVGPLTPPGDDAQGILMKDAAVLAGEQINAAGGVLGRAVEIVFADTRGLPAEGQAAAERLVQGSKIVAAFGEFHSAVALAEMDVFHRHGVPFIACDVWSDRITAAGFAEVFRIAPSDSMIAAMVGEWVRAAGFRDVTILAEPGDAGADSGVALGAMLTNDKTPFTLMRAEAPSFDFTTELKRMKASAPGCELLVIEFAGARAHRLIVESHGLGLAPSANTALFASEGAGVDSGFWPAVGSAGVFVCSENDAPPRAAWNDKTKSFAGLFKERFKADATSAAMESYDAAFLLADAIRAAGTTAPKPVIAALEATHMTGTRGVYRFSTSKIPAWAYHQFMDAPLTLIQYDRPKQPPADAPILWPRRFASSAALYHRPAA